MDTNLYEKAREHSSFKGLQSLVENLDMHIETHAPDVYREFMGQEEESVLSSLDWSDLNRKGEGTMRENTYVPWGYERPGVRIYAVAVFDSESEELYGMSLRVKLGHSMDDSLQDSEEYKTVKFEVSRGGTVSRTV